MIRRRSLVAGLAATTVAGCTTQPQPLPKYDGPEVTRVVVTKADRRMYLLHNGEILRRYRVALGFEPVGHKTEQGDGRTPEGHYRIDRRNTLSDFYLSLGISYPNRRDRAQARARGVRPGGDIFIHGQPNKWIPQERDWTWGCIAVQNHEMYEIFQMVQVGTLISIQAT